MIEIIIKMYNFCLEIIHFIIILIIVIMYYYKLLAENIS